MTICNEKNTIITISGNNTIIKNDISEVIKMQDKYMKLVMNPIRLRIIQYLMKNERGTTAEIKEELSDIPTTSLYRHMKLLLEGGCIEILEEKQLRGTVEKTYGLVNKPVGEMTSEKANQIISEGLLSLMESFRQYFSSGESVDPKADKLLFATSTIFLSDEEFEEVGEEVQKVIDQYLSNKPGEEGKQRKQRKQRRITIISSPCEKEGYADDKKSK